MAKFLDLTGLSHFKERIEAWAKGAFISVGQKGTANGVAELDSSGKVPSSQLPSYVDDVVEGYLSDGKFYKESQHTTAINGESSKIYMDLSTNKIYRWSGSKFAEISSSLALGETSSTAYRGDRGKAAYDHSQLTSGNPHKVTKSDVGLSNVTNERQMKGLSSGTTQGHVIVFGADGYTPKDSGFTIGKSVPANAEFTDTKPVNMKGATSSEAGSAGYAPAPAAGAQNKYLRGDGTWQTPPNTTYGNFKGASSSAAGESGLVPAPAEGEQSKFLKGDGTWQAITVPSVDAITTTEIDDLFS